MYFKKFNFANIRYYYTEQETKQNPVGQILVKDVKNIIQEKKNIQETNFIQLFIKRKIYTLIFFL